MGAKAKHLTFKAMTKDLKIVLKDSVRPRQRTPIAEYLWCLIHAAPVELLRVYTFIASPGHCANMTSYIKSEVHNASLRRQMRTEPQL